MNRHIHIIINPASGQTPAALETISDLCREAGVTWEVSVTKQAGDATPLARAAAQAGADVVAAYGGDGTVADVASGLVGTDARLAILPGGTANVMSVELGIPSTLAEACALACSEDSAEIALDLIEHDRGGHIILQAGIGLHGVMVEYAGRARKRRLGRLAYALGLLKAFRLQPHSRYSLILDSQTITCEGVACMLCNAGSFGSGTLTLSPAISPHDGLLDVMVLHQIDFTTLLRVLWDAVRGREPATAQVSHWRSRTVTVVANPPQKVQSDGCLIGRTPITVRNVPEAVRVLVPAEAHPGTAQTTPQPEASAA